MKKYPIINEIRPMKKENVARMNEMETLLSVNSATLIHFQEMLRTSGVMNEFYCGNALEIAEGLQPWIDALALRGEQQTP